MVAMSLAVGALVMTLYAMLKLLSFDV